MTRIVFMLTMLLTGCASDPNLWLIYAKIAHTYGRVEAKTELLCAPPVKVSLADYCAEAARTREAVERINPIIQAELTKKRPDWPRIMQYLDLVLSLASKAL